MIALLASTGAVLLTSGVGALGAGAPRALGLPTAAALAGSVALLGALVALVVVAGRRERDPVLDPRTGTDMVPPPPRWATAVTFGCPLLLLVVVFVLGRTSG